MTIPRSKTAEESYNPHGDRAAGMSKSPKSKTDDSADPRSEADLAGRWKLTTRLGQPIAAGTLEQMLAHLKYAMKDGEYRLIRSDTTIQALRYQGVLYPFDQWEGYIPIEKVNQLRRQP